MKKAYEALCRLEALIAGTFLVLMVALIFTGGVARLMAHPLNWTTDIATCLFAWACFFCGDIAWRRNSLMSIEILTERLPLRLQSFCQYCNYLIIGGFLVYVIIAGCWLSWVSRARSFHGIPEVSYSWITMSLPVGGALLLLTTILKVRDDLRRTSAQTRSGDVPASA